MSIKARNAHFTNWAKVIAALADKGVTDESTARAFLANSENNPFYYMVCFIKDSKEIYTHGQFYLCSGSDYDDSELRDYIENQRYCEVTHSELANLKNNSKLTPGTHYRITDFVTTTKQNSTRSANHNFDIVVQALTTNILSEDVRAVKHAGDTYFANSDLEAWRLKYSLEGDASRFAWAKETARNQSWQCAWGVLESKPNNEASSNYTIAQIEGQTKYLYRPDSPSTFLESKQFYRMVGKETIYVEDYQDVAFVTTESPFDVGGESLTLIAIHIPTTQILGTWPSSSDWGGEEEYNVGFGEEDGSIFDMVTNGSTIEIAGQTYFSWNPYGEDYDVISSWINDNNPFVVSEGTKEYYNGNTNSLFYAFDTALSKVSIYVKEVSDGVYLYNCEGEETFDYITYKSFVSQEDGGKGVVYRLIDEFDNDCPYDFKNIQLQHEGNWYYTFDNSGSDRSLSKTCYNNTLSYGGNSTYIQKYIFKGHTFNNRFGHLTNISLFEGQTAGNEFTDSLYITNSIIAKNKFENNRISGAITIDAQGEFLGNTIDGTVSIISNGFFDYNDIRCASASQVLETNGDVFFNKFYLQNRGITTLQITTGRMQFCEIRGTGNFSITDSNGNAKGALTHSFIELGMNGSNLKLVTDATTSLNSRIEGLKINAQNWGEEEQAIDISLLPVNSTYVLNIAKNSNGEIKQWCDADLIQ